MARTVSFSVPGRPRGKARARTAPGQARPYTPARTRAAEKEIAALYQAACRPDERRPLTGDVRLDIEAVFPIPASWPKAQREAARTGDLACTAKPDRDNIEKLVCDALNGLAWVDDAQIVAGEPVKRYGEPARTVVTVTDVTDPDAPPTRAQQRREARLSAPPVPKRRAPHKSNPSKSKLPPALQAAVDRALAKERR